MFLGYLDDSGSTGRNLDDHESRFQVVAGPLIEGDAYALSEIGLSAFIADHVPEEMWDSFEFKACDLFHAVPPYDKLGVEKCHHLIERALKSLSVGNPIFYGAVDKHKLGDEQPVYADVNPVNVAFRLYLKSLAGWFERMEHTKRVTAILIADDSRKDVKREMVRAFRGFRGKIGPRDIAKGTEWADGIAMHLADDMYFGDSKTSAGIQLADICAYIIARNLAGKPDAAGFYQIIEPLVEKSDTFPH